MDWPVKRELGCSTMSNRTSSDALLAENARLGSSLMQASIDAELLLTQAGIKSIESAAAQRLQRLLLEEMHHRMKNMLAIMLGIVSQSLKNATSVEEGRVAVESRVMGLCRAQDLLMQANWSDTNLMDVVRDATCSFDRQQSPKIRITGSPLDIRASAVLPLSLSISELCTNARKYGALSVETGKVAITVALDNSAERLNLRWVESGGPIVQEPTRRGLGTRLVKSLARQISGKVILAYEPEGFSYELDVPLASIHAH